MAPLIIKKNVSLRKQKENKTKKRSFAEDRSKHKCPFTENTNLFKQTNKHLHYLVFLTSKTQYDESSVAEQNDESSTLTDLVWV